MGLKFDAQLPGMSDDELYAADESTLNEKSRRALAKEKERRERLRDTEKDERERQNDSETKDQGRRDQRGVWIRWGVMAVLAVAGLIATVMLAG